MYLATVGILLEKYDGDDYFTALTGNPSVNEDILSKEAANVKNVGKRKTAKLS